jgi:glycosyltransferase involved in cell wall biosynthesis
MKILEVTNVDFSLRHFLLPLMRGIRARGHEVVGVSADGPMLDIARAEGFRCVPVPLARSLSPVALWRGLQALTALMRAEKPDLVHAHMPISGVLARLAAWRAGVPVVAYTCHGFIFNQPGPLWRRGLGLAMEWLGGRLTDIHLTVSADEAQDARRLHIHARSTPIANGRDPACFHPDAEALRARPCRAGRATGSPGRHRGLPPRAPQGLSGAARRRCVRRRRRSLGRRRAAGVGPWARTWSRISRTAGLGPRLRRLGYRDDVPALLAAADIFALPVALRGRCRCRSSRRCFVGLPVVATNIRGPREQVIEGETGFARAAGAGAGVGHRAEAAGRRPGIAGAARGAAGLARARGSLR